MSLPEGHITSFSQFSKLFTEQYIVNKALAVVSYDLFDVRQYQGESLKDYLNRFGAQVVRLPSKDEDMLVHAFKKGVLPGPFSESLIRNHPSTFAEIRRRAVAHIVVETEVFGKRGSAAPPRPRGGQGKPQQARVHEVPVHGEVQTIAGGFSGGGCTASQRRRYARSVMAVDAVNESHYPEVDIIFRKADLRDVVPHDNDPVVISLITAGRRVHRVLVDQGSSADVMF